MTLSINEAVALEVSLIKGQEKPIGASLWDEPLTGSAIKMDSIDMAYLLLHITERFGIKFTGADLISRSFNSVNSISEIISKKSK